jgi:hypothetical protein
VPASLPENCLRTKQPGSIAVPPCDR